METNNTPQFNRKTFDFSNIISNSTKNQNTKIMFINNKKI